MPKLPQKRGAGAYWTIGAVVAVIAVLFAAKLFLQPGANAHDNQPVPPAILSAFAGLPPSLFAGVGAGTAGNLPTHVKAAHTLQSGGKPKFLYVGADYCPYCAAERWAIVLALSRFGRFSSLRYMTSSASDVYPSTPTFTFYKSSYQSPYVAFRSVELAGNTPANGSYSPLQKMTPSESALVSKYDPGGGIPFMDIGGQYILSGSNFNPGLLKGLTWKQIIAGSNKPSGPLVQAILGSANVLTAAVCASDGGKPASACSDPALKSLLSSFPQK